MTERGRRADHATRVWLALVTVYIVWGTTYLAIRVVNQTLPPLLAAGVRFLVAGTAVLAATRARAPEGDRPPGRREWRAAAIVGLALLLGGNGGVVLAERRVPSGLVALIIALVPLWMALIDGILLGRRPRPPVAVGLLAGFAGAALLVGTSAGERAPLGGMLLAVGASLSWASGSLYARTAPLPRRPFVGIGMEMLCGGAGLFLVGLIAGEAADIHPERVSLASALALAYLVVIGSLAGFGSYVWLLRNAPTSLVSTYAYVNPVVAVFLGWALLGEPVSVRTVAAGAVVLASVAIIVASRAERPVPEATSGAELREERGAVGERDLPLERVGDSQEHGLAEDRGRDLQADG